MRPSVLYWLIKGCSFGFSDPFQFLSDEGVLVARKILNKLKEDAKSNGRSLCVRGIWHISPFFKVRVGHFAKVLQDHKLYVCLTRQRFDDVRCGSQSFWVDYWGTSFASFLFVQYTNKYWTSWQWCSCWSMAFWFGQLCCRYLALRHNWHEG